MEASIRQMETLLSFYIELDEENRKKVLGETVRLAYGKNEKKKYETQSVKNGVKHGKKIAGFSKAEIDESVNATVKSRLKVTSDLMKLTDESSPDEKAALLLSMFYSGIFPPEIEEPEIKVTVTYKRQNMTDYIRGMVPLADMESSQRIFEEKYKPIVDSMKDNKGCANDQL